VEERRTVAVHAECGELALLLRGRRRKHHTVALVARTVLLADITEAALDTKAVSLSRSSVQYLFVKLG